MVKNIQTLCSRCPKSVHCCKFNNSNGFVFIGIKDAENIRKRFNLKYDDFLQWKPFSKKTISLLKKSQKYSEGFMRQKQLRKNHLLILKKKKNKDCIFFDKNKCSIYQFRPLICRIYPYWFFLGEKMHIISHGEYSRCKALKQCRGDVILKKTELKELRNLSKKIELEDKYYRKNIKSFLHRLKKDYSKKPK